MCVYTNTQQLSTWVLLLVHESHDVLHEVPPLLSILRGLGLLHEVRDLHLPSWQGRQQDTHLLQDGHMFTVAEVQSVDIQPRWGVCLLAQTTARWKMSKSYKLAVKKMENKDLNLNSLGVILVVHQALTAPHTIESMSYSKS